MPVVDRAAGTDLQTATAEQIVAYAVGRFGTGLALAASFQDCVLIDIATRVCPAIEVVFLDTGFHFPETLSYVEGIRRRYHLRLTVIGPPTDACPPCGQTGCCQPRKVHALDRRPRGQARLDERPTSLRQLQCWLDTPGRGRVSSSPPPGQGQPDRPLERPRHRRLFVRARIWTRPSSGRGWIHVDRLSANHPAGGSRRSPPLRPMARNQPDGVRSPPVKRTSAGRSCGPRAEWRAPEEQEEGTGEAKHRADPDVAHREFAPSR